MNDPNVPKTKTIKKNSHHPASMHPVSRFFWRFRHIMPLVTLVIVALGTYLAVQMGKGYRPTFDGKLLGTGLLAANSFPPGAQVYIDGKLTTATDDTLNLTPSDYEIEIRKEGYLPWYKTLSIKKELVSQTNATLFKSVASLTPLTLSGATNVAPSPDGQKIAYVVASASATAKNGLYIADLTSSQLSLQRGPRQIARVPTNFDLTSAHILWSPNSAQILVHATNKNIQYNYLLEADRTTDFESLSDVTARLNLILSQWEEDIVLRETKQLAILPGEMQQVATMSATNVYFSPNEERIIYTATQYFDIPTGLSPQPPSPSTQQESRSIKPNFLYVYDIVEDRNYELGPITLDENKPQKHLLRTLDYQQLNGDAATPSATPIINPNNIPLTAYTKLQDTESIDTTVKNFQAHYSSIYVDGFQWYPNSTHVLITQNDKVEVVEYDSTNRLTLYAGPFEDNFIYPWPDGTRLIILTNLNPTSATGKNLYTVDIR